MFSIEVPGPVKGVPRDVIPQVIKVGNRDVLSLRVAPLVSSKGVGISGVGVGLGVEDYEVIVPGVREGVDKDFQVIDLRSVDVKTLELTALH